MVACEVQRGQMPFGRPPRAHGYFSTCLLECGKDLYLLGLTRVPDTTTTTAAPPPLGARASGPGEEPLPPPECWVDAAAHGAPQAL